MWGFGHYGMGYGHMGWGGLFGGGIWLLLLILVAFAIVGFTRGRPLGGRPSSSGLAILEERYARGEIDREEYLQKKQDLLK